MKSDMEINDLVASEELRRAAKSAAQLNPRFVAEHIDYHALSDNSESWLEFAKLWIAEADPLDRLEIAAWIIDRSVAEMSYLRIQEEAALILERVTGDALNRMAEIVEAATVLSSGPDAGITKGQAAKYVSAAAVLKKLPLS